MTLFSAPDEAASHRTRIVLAEKDVEIEIVSVTPGRFPEDLLDLNPDHSLPTLVDPFPIGPGWFVLNLNTLHVERGDAAPEAEWDRIAATLPVLNHRLCVQEREEYVRCYRLGPGAGGFDLAHLEYRAPFIASELRRQGQLVRGDT